MLPDFPKTKEKLKKMIISEMKKAQSRHLGALANAPVSRMFEGNKSIVETTAFNPMEQNRTLPSVRR